MSRDLQKSHLGLVSIFECLSLVSAGEANVSAWSWSYFGLRASTSWVHPWL